MSYRIASILLPPSFSRHARTAWLLALALAPLAYIAGGAILLRTDPNARTNYQLDRAGAAGAAAAHAAALGADVADWSVGVRSIVSKDRHDYYRLVRDEAAERFRRLAPEAYLRVQFVAPDRGEAFSVEMDPAGRLLGYKLTPRSDAEVADPGEPASRAAAAAIFARVQQEEGWPAAAPPEFTEDRKFGSVVRHYTWRVKVPELPNLQTQLKLSTLGDRVVSREIVTDFDDAYARGNFVSRRLPAKIAGGAHYALLFLVACYGLYRYLRRSWQKEVPHARSLLLGANVAGFFFFISLQSDFYLLDLPIGETMGGIFWISLIATSMVFALYGTVFGMAYGSSEGDVREAYPGKLTSLDALLTGRLSSRNVARAVCVGAALGGWVFLARNLLLLPWAFGAAAAQGPGLSDSFWTIAYGHSSWLLPLTNPPLISLEIALAGLMLPLSLLLRGSNWRYLKSPKLRLGLLVALSLVSSLSVFSEQALPFVAGLAIAATRTAALLTLFFAFDLLTAIVGLMFPTIVVYSLYLFAQPAASLSRTGLLTAGVAFSLFAAALVFVFRGREYVEEEVRPLYARHLAERTRLEGEVSTAREAQVRLLPQRLPEIENLSLAAACRPAHIVGGDFYDFFPLNGHRLGVFVAEGGDQGLGAALTIAYAKGFLMPRLAAGHTPTEIVCDLQERLASFLGADQQVSIAYAEIDTARRTLAYARAGSYPQVRVNRRQDGGDAVAARRRKSGDRNKSAWFELPQAERSADGGRGAHEDCPAVREATIELLTDDSVIFVTDGIVKNLQADRQQPLEEWTAKLLDGDGAAGKLRNADNSLQDALDRALEKRARRARKLRLEDDLTAVVLRLEKPFAVPREAKEAS